MGLTWHGACIPSLRATQLVWTGQHLNMDMNLIASQIKTPTSSSPSDGTASLASTAQSPNSANTRKSFSSVLHRAYQEKSRLKAQKSNGTQSQDGPNTETRKTHTSDVESHSSQPEDSQPRSTETSTGRTQDNQKDESTRPVGDDRDTSLIEFGNDSVSQEQLLALMQTPTPGTVITQPAFLEPVKTNEEVVTTSEDGQATAQTVIPMFVSIPTTENPDVAVPANQRDLSSSDTTTPATQYSEQPSPEEALSDSRNQLSQGPELEPPTHPDVSLHRTMATRGETIQAVEQHEPATEESNHLYDQTSQLHPEQSLRDTIASPLTSRADRSLEEVQVQRPAPSQAETTVRSLPENEASNSKPAPELPHSWQSFSDLEQQSDMQWFAREDKQHERGETSLPQGASIQNRRLHESNSPAASALTVGTVAQPMPRSLDIHAVPPATPAQPMTATHDVSDMPMPAMTRSVVLEVEQPDLGRINVRVSMTNEQVHTHFSSDRSEVGQLLINGQDRLQSALQANGLDMGQFRVDIDRQSAGRSFQQGQPQEQGRTWYQNPGHPQGDAPADAHDVRLTRPHGMLNLVA